MRRLLLVTCALCGGAALAQQELDPQYGADAVRIENIGGSDVSLLDRGEGVPVLFYHPNNAIFEWQRMVEAVASRYRTVVNGPLPFLGPPSGADALVQFLEALNLGPVHLVAHSFGGRQAMSLALSRPDLLRSLVLVEPAGAANLEDLRAQERDLQVGNYRCDLPEALHGAIAVDSLNCLLQAQINEPGFLRNAPVALVRHLVERTGAAAPPSTQGEEAPLASLPGGFAALLPPICDELQDIDAPVLFVRGALTPDIIRRNLDGYEDCLPDHRSVTIPGSGHYPHVYNPEAFASELLRFFASQPGTR